jgi:acetylornithine deacetylase/succinyl-diaminopimelate desuccinylase-like protein
VLPHEAVAKCDIRLVEAQTVEDILAKVKARDASNSFIEFSWGKKVVQH